MEPDRLPLVCLLHLAIEVGHLLRTQSTMPPLAVLPPGHESEGQAGSATWCMVLRLSLEERFAVGFDEIIETPSLDLGLSELLTLVWSKLGEQDAQASNAA